MNKYTAIEHRVIIIRFREKQFSYFRKQADADIVLFRSRLVSRTRVAESKALRIRIPSRK